MKKFDAYWISPRGIVVEVSRKHIDTIIDDPTQFGLTDNYIKQIYDKHDEPMNLEGEAREEIMRRLMKKGWIRVRYYGRQDFWQFQTYYFGKRDKDNIWGFLSDGLDRKVVNKFSEINLLIISTGRKLSASMSRSSELFEVLLSEHKKFIEIKQKRKRGLMETTLSRVWRHFKNKDVPVVIISAFRPFDEKSKETGISDNRTIASEAQALGYGYVFVNGMWEDNEGRTQKEDSILIIGDINDNGRLKGMVKKWLRRYNQDTALWKDAGTLEISLMHPDGSTLKIGQRFSQKAAEHGYTKLRGRGKKVFTFESADRVMGWLERWKQILMLEGD